MRIDELMTRDVVTVAPATPLRRVAELLTEHGISGLPVCNEAGTVVGVVSETDVVRREDCTGRGAGVPARLLRRRRAAAPRTARTAGEAMSAPAVVAPPALPVSRAARLLLEHGITRLPVVEDGRLVGIVTQADLVRAFHRPDGEVAREIRQGVLLHDLWIDPGSVDVSVEDGEVTLRGEVASRSEAALVETFTRCVAGVAGVRSQLGWRADDAGRPVPSGPR